MSMEKDILTLADIRLLVDSFYDKVRDNSLLAPIFNERIGDAWPLHLEKMYRFWETVLLDAYTYTGAPFTPHANLPVAHAHFEEWMRLFQQTVDELFSGEKAEEAKWRAGRMAEMFEHKINYYKDKGFRNML